MVPENFTIHPDHKVLQNLIYFNGQPAGEEILERIQNGGLVLVIGEPAIGKSTIVAELHSEMHRRGRLTTSISYDQELANYTRQTGSSEEGPEFNQLSAKRIRSALLDLPQGGLVIAEGVGVGKRSPKDRWVSTVDDVVIPSPDSEPYPILILGIVATLRDQFRNSFTRLDILLTPAEDILDLLKNKHNISVTNIPDSMSRVQVGSHIKVAVAKMATQLHVAQISREVTLEALQAIHLGGARRWFNLPIPSTLNPVDGLYLRMKGFAMDCRLANIPTDPINTLGVYNLHRDEERTWYFDSFLPQE